MNTVDKYIKNGRIIQMPRKLTDKEQIFDFVSDFFEEEKEYTEIEVNEILSRLFDDHALLRRYLVDYRILGRNREGTRYKKIPK